MNLQSRAVTGNCEIWRIKSQRNWEYGTFKGSTGLKWPLKSTLTVIKLYINLWVRLQNNNLVLLMTATLVLSISLHRRSNNWMPEQWTTTAMPQPPKTNGLVHTACLHLCIILKALGGCELLCYVQTNIHNKIKTKYHYQASWSHTWPLNHTCNGWELACSERNSTEYNSHVHLLV